MPRAILEFDVPEEEREFRLAVDGPEVVFAVGDALNGIRSLLKYQSDTLSEGEQAGLERARDLVIDALHDRNVSWVLD